MAFAASDRISVPTTVSVGNVKVSYRVSVVFGFL
jgi:hypothetical protein